MTKSKISKFLEKEGTQGWLMILPNSLGLLVFYLIPIVWSIILAFFQWNGLSDKKFVGFYNIVKLFSDSSFLSALRNTLVYSLAVVPAIIILVVIFGNALANEKIFGAEKLRTLYFLPLMTMPVAAALVWKWLLNTQYGLFNTVLRAINLPAIPWVSDARFVLLSVIFIGVWLGVAYDLIIIISGIKGIPNIYYEAAEIDGASPLRQFFSITLPLLSPTIFFIVITQLISCFQVFDSASVILGSAPAGALENAAGTVVLSIYKNGFIFFNMGYSSAQSLILFLIVLVITAVQFKLQKKWVHYA
ncbi:MAG: carbohydrate ABC transporter permease [Sphaerochaeta sp.]